MPQKTRFTIYDAMEQSGIFASNPANPGARDNDGNPLYVGPVTYPKMLYHPAGLERIVVPAEIVMTPLGAREYNEQKQLIDKTVHNRDEHDAALAEGWHEHPAKAIEARIRALIESSELTDSEEAVLLAKIPKLSPSANRVAELEAEIARLNKLKLAGAPPAAKVA